MASALLLCTFALPACPSRTSRADWRRLSRPVGRGRRDCVRGEPAARCPTKAAARRLAPFGLRIIRAMQPSAARGKTAECVVQRDRRASAIAVIETSPRRSSAQRHRGDQRDHPRRRPVVASRLKGGVVPRPHRGGCDRKDPRPPERLGTCLRYALGWGEPRVRCAGSCTISIAAALAP
jgi:hypothetical protein